MVTNRATTIIDFFLNPSPNPNPKPNTNPNPNPIPNPNDDKCKYNIIPFAEKQGDIAMR